MTTVTHLFAALGTMTAVVLLVVMAAVPILLDLPLRSTLHRPTPHRPTPHRPARKGADPRGTRVVDERRVVTDNVVCPASR